MDATEHTVARIAGALLARDTRAWFDVELSHRELFVASAVSAAWAIVAEVGSSRNSSFGRDDDTTVEGEPA